MSTKETRSRDRPITTNNTVETNSTAENVFPDTTYEFNSFWVSLSTKLDDVFGCSISSAFTPEEIKQIITDPIGNHELTRRLGMFCYNTDGVVTNSIDYMVSLPCLDRVVCSKDTKRRLFKKKKKTTANKDLMLSALENINDKQFIRDVLHTDMNEGTSFYYFETTSKAVDRTRFMNDWDVENIIELCDVGMNAVMIPLPYEYCKIVGRKNGRYVIAFNLLYFDENCVSSNDRDRRLRQYPAEIRDAYLLWDKGNKTGNHWVVLNNDHTIAHKIKCKISEPWGRPLAIAAIADILYQDEFVNTKRNILREMNNRCVVQTLPEGKDKGSCALTKTQQRDQHDKVKQAILQKNNRGGTTFVTVSAGTKIDAIDIDGTDIFDDKNESDLTDKIALDMGMAAQLLGASTTGTFAGGQHNLEMITAQIYTWVHEIQTELNHVINACVIKDPKNKVEVYYLPTSMVNRDGFFNQMKSLYLEAGGSLTFLIAATGISPEMYMSVLDEEIDNGIFDRYLPHQTAYTQSSKTDNKGGRPEVDNPTDNTIKSRENNGNNIPSPSDK